MDVTVYWDNAKICLFNNTLVIWKAYHNSFVRKTPYFANFRITFVKVTKISNVNKQQITKTNVLKYKQKVNSVYLKIKHVLIKIAVDILVISMKRLIITFVPNTNNAFMLMEYVITPTINRV